MIGKIIFVAAAGLLTWAASAPSPGVLNDAQIAHIAYTADAIDVAAGRQALTRSKNAQVRAFAEEMVRDHTAVNDQALTLVERLGVTPQDNPTSVALSKAADDAHGRLSLLSGPAFDRAYVRNEVAFHHSVNDALRTTLIPGAQNEELRALLEAGLRLFGEHQMHAEHLVTKLG